MKRVLRTAMMALLTIILCVGMLAPAAFAAEDVINAEIPVNVTVSGSKPVEGAFVQFKLEPITADAPVPTTPTLGISLTGEGTFTSNLQVPCTKMGVYDYKLTMVGGTYYLDALKYDSYYVRIYMLNDGPQIRIYKNVINEDNKPNDISYEIPLKEYKLVKKWSGGTGNEVKIQMSYKITESDSNSVIYGTYKLNDSNSWQTIVSGLNGRLIWNAAEIDVPGGFTASYKYNGNIITVTNTKALHQTGQLNWPIPVLVCCGSVLMLAGILMLRKREEQ